MVLAFQEVSMMLQLGNIHVYLKNVNACWKKMNLFGLIQHILFVHGAKRHSKSEFWYFDQWIVKWTPIYSHSPEKSIPENSEYNNQVSRVRIRSEHCMGYLKGRWSSLRGLRLRIDHQGAKELTSLWIMTCIHLHNFAIGHERWSNVEADYFFVEGERLMLKERQERLEWEERRARALAAQEAAYQDGSDEAMDLLAGRIKREQLKHRLFESYQGQ